MEMNIGWLCPRCGKVNSPYVQHCTCTQENKAAERKEEKQTEKAYEENKNNDYSTYYVKIKNSELCFSHMFVVVANNRHEAEVLAKDKAVKYYQNKNIPCGTLKIVSVSKGMIYGGENT